jgi:hypothetical protein
VTASGEQVHATSCSTKGTEFIEQPSDCCDLKKDLLRGDSYLPKTRFRFTYLTNEQAQASDCRRTNLPIQYPLQTTFCSFIERNDLTLSRFPWIRGVATRIKPIISSLHRRLYRHVLLLLLLLLLFQTASVVWWSEFLATDPEVRVRFAALPDFLRSSGSRTVSTQPRKYNWGAAWKRKQRLRSRKPRIRP